MPPGEVHVMVVTIFGLLSLALALLLLVVLAGCVLGLAAAAAGLVIAIVVFGLAVRSIRRWRHR